jgi:hypothetical protein
LQTPQPPTKPASGSPALTGPASDYPTDQRRRRPLDWPDDLVESADYLGIDRFFVVGVLRRRLERCGLRIPPPAPARTHAPSCPAVGHVSIFVTILARWPPWIVTYVIRR